MGYKLVKDNKKETYNLYSTIVDDYLLEDFTTLENVFTALEEIEIENLKHRLEYEKENYKRTVKDRKEIDEFIKLVHG